MWRGLQRIINHVDAAEDWRGDDADPGDSEGKQGQVYCRNLSERRNSGQSDGPNPVCTLCTSRVPRNPGPRQRAREWLPPQRWQTNSIEADDTQPRQSLVRVSVRVRDGQGRRGAARPSGSPCRGDVACGLQERSSDDVVSRRLFKQASLMTEAGVTGR
jgi:hypothetical protein